MTTLNDGTRGIGGAERAEVAAIVSQGPCPTPELLRAEAEGVLPADLSARVSTHRAACSLCARLQSALTQLEISAPTSTERRRIRARMGVATKDSNN